MADGPDDDGRGPDQVALAAIARRFELVGAVLAEAAHLMTDAGEHVALLAERSGAFMRRPHEEG